MGNASPIKSIIRAVGRGQQRGSSTTFWPCRRRYKYKRGSACTGSQCVRSPQVRAGGHGGLAGRVFPAAPAAWQCDDSLPVTALGAALKRAAAVPDDRLGCALQAQPARVIRAVLKAGWMRVVPGAAAARPG